MTDLSGGGVQVVLIGVGEHQPESLLPGVPSVVDTVTELRRCLVDRCGVPESRIRDVVNPERPEDIIDVVLDASAQAPGTLVIYYVGHGVLDADGALYLATRATRDLSLGKAAYQALPFEQVDKELRNQRRAGATVVMLDCCFSARAALSLPDHFLIASADRNELAIAASDAEFPVFSGQLISLLRDGDPQGPRQWTFSAVYRRLASTLAEQGHPVPRHSARGDAGDLVLATNAAYRAPSDPDEQSPPDADAFDGICPYRGLAAYGTGDAYWFRGRAHLTESLVRALAARVWTGRPLAVVGASGSGKSSLLRAGLVPALQHGDLGVPGSAAWPCVSFAPGAQPVRAFRDSMGAPDDGGGSFQTVARRALEKRLGRPAGSQDRLVIIVDQFEELLTQCQDDAARREFVAGLFTLADGDSLALVVLGLRSDFYGACTAYPELVAALADDPVVVGPMTTGELRSVIQEPAELAGLAPQAALVEILLRDVGADPDDDQAAGYDPGVLPLLSFALQETWKARRQRMLTVDGYRAIGGINKAVAQVADAVYKKLNKAAQGAVRQLLLRLVSVRDDTADARRTADRASLLADSPDARATEDAMHAFAEARLLTMNAETVEITHEALIRGWPQLKDWIDADRAGHHTRQRIAADADLWVKARHDPAHLYTGNRLGTALEHVTGNLPELGPIGAEFIRSSLRQRQLTAWRQRAFLVTLALVTVVAVAAAVVAFQQRGSAVAQSQEAVRQRDTALSRQLAAESLNLDDVEPNLAKQLALAGYRLAATPDATGAAFAALSAPGVIHTPAQVGAVAFSPDGSLLAIGAGHDIKLWDEADHAFISALVGHTNQVTGIAFDSGGAVLASVAEDQAIRLWNVADPGHPALLAILHGEYSSVAFSPDGRVLVAGDYDGTVRWWGMTSPRAPAARPPLTGPTGSVLAVAVSPNGELIAGASVDGTIRLWPSRGGPSVATLTGAGDTAIGDQIAFAPDSRLVAGVAQAGRVGLWPATRPGKVPPETTLPGGASYRRTVAFSPYDDVVAAGGDNDVQLWDVTQPRHALALSTLAMDDANGRAASNLNGSSTTVFSPDGSTLVGGTGSDVVELWNVSDTHHPGAVAMLDNAPGTVTATTSEVARHIFAVGTTSPDAGAGDVILWDLTDPTQPRRIAIIRGPAVWSLEFSPDGKVLAVSGADGSIGLWDVSTPARPHRESVISTDGDATSATFNADGRTLAVRMTYQTVRLWNVTDPGRPTGGHVFTGVQDLEFSPANDIFVLTEPSSFQVWRARDADHPALITEVPEAKSDLAFSPDGRMMAMTDLRGAIGVWDLSVPDRPRELSVISGNNAYVTMVFSPDSLVLAVNDEQSDSTRVHLWDVSNPDHPQQFATTVPSGQAPANFASGGTLGVPDGSAVNLWPTAPALIMRLSCTGSGDLVTKDQWQQYLPDVPYDPPCG